eukprot:1231041-Pyramimonas_sp.AAC.1
MGFRSAPSSPMPGNPWSIWATVVADALGSRARRGSSGPRPIMQSWRSDSKGMCPSDGVL